MAFCALAACSDDESTFIVGPTPSPTVTGGMNDTPTPTEVGFTPTAVPTGTATAVPTGTVTATIVPTQNATPTSTQIPPEATATPIPQGIQFHGSIEQAYVTDAMPGAEYELRRIESSAGKSQELDGGEVIGAGVADHRGSFIWRDLEPGGGYMLIPLGVINDDRPGAYGPVTVTGLYDHPDASIFEGQEIGPGYGYLRTRDGTLLSINVILPGPVEGGPYPTLIEYSGYTVSDPAPNQPGMLIGPLLGFATVGVNIRGTGCSGGAFNYFESAQSTDGYDAIEVIARQPWVKGNKVGMIGVSYPGISQLFTAQTQPPSLAGIAPLSVISNTGRGILYPGGILNNGFAVEWAEDRQRDAMAGGQRWARERMEEGDQVCIDNQKLTDQAPDIIQQIEDNPYYTDEVAAPLAPATFVDRINVPVFLAGAWQDEQTGPYFPTMLDRFTGTDKIHMTLLNGGHADPLGPAIFGRWYEFLSFYIKEEIPVLPPTAGPVLMVIGESVFGTDNLRTEPDRFNDGRSFEEALAAFESEPQVRILFENGAGDPEVGAPYPAFEHSFEAWPIPELEPAIWYLAENGLLVPDPPSGDGEDSYVYDPTRSQETNFGGGNVWDVMPNWQWDLVDEGTAVVYTTEPLEEDAIMAGSGSIDLWFKSTAPDTDIQVTLSEVRPDGYEVYIQNTWMRTSLRKLDEAASTVIRPVHTGREADVEDLPDGEFAALRLELFPFAHAFRASSRIRVSVESPGGSRALWKFEVLEAPEEVVNTVARSSMYPSRIVLPFVPGADIPTDLPPCPWGLRSQPCRDISVIEQ
jgi:predicted acyl esterase